MSLIVRRSAALLATTFSVLVALLALTATSANAAWSTLGQSGDQVKYLICKTPVDSGYGPLWKLTLVMASSSDYRGSADFRVVRGGSLVSALHLDAGNGAWDVQTTYASRYWDDQFQTSFGAGQISTGQGLGYTMTGPQSFSSVGYC
jgi:hypothetical protein